MDTELFMECEEEELEPWQQVDNCVEEDDGDFMDYTRPGQSRPLVLKGHVFKRWLMSVSVCSGGLAHLYPTPSDSAPSDPTPPDFATSLCTCSNR